MVRKKKEGPFRPFPKKRKEKKIQSKSKSLPSLKLQTNNSANKISASIFEIILTISSKCFEFRQQHGRRNFRRDKKWSEKQKNDFITDETQNLHNNFFARPFGQSQRKVCCMRLFLTIEMYFIRINTSMMARGKLLQNTCTKFFNILSIFKYFIDFPDFLKFSPIFRLFTDFFRFSIFFDNCTKNFPVIFDSEDGNSRKLGFSHYYPRLNR